MSRLSLLPLALAVLGALAIGAAVSFAGPPVLLRTSFPAGGLVTNEFAFWHPRDARARTSPVWRLTSGSLFARRGAGWSGRPDDCAPDPLSRRCTNSAIFRLTTRRADLRSVRVSLRLRLLALAQTPSTPAVDWDGVHVFLRYEDEHSLYYASAARRDGSVAIKKKCRGGPSNGGTYSTLAQRGGFPARLGEWTNVAAEVADLAGGGVRIRLLLSGKPVLVAYDRGVGCAPLAHGRVGIRGDNAEFLFRDFTVRGLP